MDRPTNEPLTPAQAKERLRAAAREAGVASWVRRHPWQALVGGVSAGFVMGSLPPDIRRSLGRRLSRFLFQFF